MKVPTKEECVKILRGSNVPENIIAHTSAVSEFAGKICDFLNKKGIKVNKKLVLAGALLHDIKKLEPDHEIKGSEYIKSIGYVEVSNLIRKHGLSNLDKEDCIPKTWEEKIVFYSDKRLNGNKVVSVEERFDYIRKRYNKPEVEEEYRFSKRIEKEIFGDFDFRDFK